MRKSRSGQTFDFLLSYLPDSFLVFKFDSSAAQLEVRKIWQVDRAPPGVASPVMTKQPTTLGAFSVSLAVKDLQASREFYEKLGFEAAGGDAAQNWLILRNETVTIGLFQGMFDRNVLTFNPGWDYRGQGRRREVHRHPRTSARPQIEGPHAHDGSRRKHDRPRECDADGSGR